MYGYLALAAVLVAFDAAATVTVVDAGLAYEANPLWSASAARVGIGITMVARLLVGWGGIGLLWWAHREGSRLAAPALIFACFLLSVVAGWQAAYLTEVFR